VQEYACLTQNYPIGLIGNSQQECQSYQN